MTPQKVQITQDGTPQPLMKEMIVSDNDTTSSLSSILTPDELESSRLMNAQFFVADYQVPNDYIELGKDEKGNPIYEAFNDPNDPKYKEFEMIRTKTRDSESGIETTLVAFVTDYHRMKYPDRYKAFKAGQQIGVQGISIDELPNVPQAVKNTLQANGIITIEQLAKLSNPANAVPNGAAYQRIARKYLESTTSSKTDKLEEENEALKEEFAAMKAQLAELLKAAKK